MEKEIPRATTGGPTRTKVAPIGSFGRALCEAREAQGLTRAAMARRITETAGDGFVCSPQHVTYWEGGDRQITEETVGRYARALGVGATLRLGGVE